MLAALAQDFSPRFECHRDDLITIDMSGLTRLLGDPRAIGEELRRSAAARGLRVHVAVAPTRTAAMLLALASPGLTIVDRAETALAPMAIGVLERIYDTSLRRPVLDMPERSGARASGVGVGPHAILTTLQTWGVKTLGELAALPSTDLAARLGQQGLVWQSLARGRDVRPLVPTLPEERFESSIELEWPIEGLEPLSFVLTRLLEPLSTRLERRDRGAAAIHVMLDLVKHHDDAILAYSRNLQLPSPIRDVRTLRTLILLDLESHPPPAAIERVRVVIDPTPGRVLQHTLFVRAHPTPEQVSTLVARLNALMGQDRVGRPVLVDSYRPGAFEMLPFAEAHPQSAGYQPLVSSLKPLLISALRRCRQPVPARVVVAQGRPVHVTTDRRGFAGGRVLTCAGPWRTSGQWWEQSTREPSPERESLRSSARTSEEAWLASGGGAPRAGRKDASRVGGDASLRHPVLNTREGNGLSASGVGVGPHASKKWDRDEWDVSLDEGAVYRIFRDRETESWFVDAIVD